MQNPSIIVTSRSISVIFDGEKPRSITSDSPNFKKCLENIKARNWSALKENIDIESCVKNYVSQSGDVRISNGQIYYLGEIVANTITDRIIGFMREGMPFEPLVRFLENLMKNPSFRARKELYSFLETESLPVTEDGHFLAYKAVRQDYYDIYSGTVYNGIGSVVSMPRFNVDDNCNNGCSSGLHAGSLSYVENYGGQHSRKIIVKINPADVVSVPSEDHRKLRTCKYKVVSEFKGEFNRPLYTEEGDHYTSDCLDSCCEDDFDDEDDFGDTHPFFRRN